MMSEIERVIFGFADYPDKVDYRLASIKGFGDPFLVSEELAQAAHALAGKLKDIRGVILDTTYLMQLIVLKLVRY